MSTDLAVRTNSCYEKIYPSPILKFDTHICLHLNKKFIYPLNTDTIKVHTLFTHQTDYFQKKNKKLVI